MRALPRALGLPAKAAAAPSSATSRGAQEASRGRPPRLAVQKSAPRTSAAPRAKEQQPSPSQMAPGRAWPLPPSAWTAMEAPQVAPRTSPRLLVAAEPLQVVLAEMQSPALPPAAGTVVLAQPHGGGSYHYRHVPGRCRSHFSGPLDYREPLRISQHQRQLLRRGAAQQAPAEVALLQAAAAGAQSLQGLIGERHGRCAAAAATFSGAGQSRPKTKHPSGRGNENETGSSGRGLRNPPGQ